MYVELKIGDVVYCRSPRGWTGHGDRGLHTIVRETHKGSRLVTDKGVAILKRNNYEVGEYYTQWHKYTPEVQAEWDAEDRRKKVEHRLRNVHLEMQHYRYYPVESLEEIADVLEKHVRAYNESRKQGG